MVLTNAMNRILAFHSKARRFSAQLFVRSLQSFTAYSDFLIPRLELLNIGLVARKAPHRLHST